MRNRIGAFIVLVIVNAVVPFAAWGQRSTAQTYKKSAGMYADAASSNKVVTSSAAAQDKLVAKESYDVVISICNFMYAADNPKGILEANGVSGEGGAAYYYIPRGLEMPSNVTSTLVQGPSHGRLVPSTEFPKDFIYYPDEGYVGADRVTFSVDVDGKHFKVIQNIYVTNGAPDALKGPELMKACPDTPVIKENTPNKSSSSSSASSKTSAISGGSIDQTIGVCADISVSDDKVSAPLSILSTLESYLKNVEKLSDWHATNGVVTVLESPDHGFVADPSGHSRYIYIPKAGYFGSDKATFLVTVGSQKYKLVYVIHVNKEADEEGYVGCDQGVWRISLDQGNVDPSAVAFGLPEPMSSGLVKNVNVSLNVVKLTDVNVLVSRSSSIALSERDVEYGWVLKLRSKIPSGSRRKEVAI